MYGLSHLAIGDFVTNLLRRVHVAHAFVSTRQRQRGVVRLQKLNASLTHGFRQARIVAGYSCAEDGLPTVKRDGFFHFL
ncbi:hypothetical protein ACJ60J_003701 [Salmonella enterica subsp. enterica serovar Eko]